MCGICGVIDNTTSSNLGEGVIRKMCEHLKHRGPDDEGIYINNQMPSLGLGHRRLSIIDLSAAGHQPMPNEDKTVWIVLNGEIYNYKELRKDLEAKGHIFRSHTDTETVLHLYEEYGRDCLGYLRGMFAFAIWDQKRQALLLARDRVGKKPLLYHYANGVFCFASEFSSLLQSGLIEKRINPRAIDYYLTFGCVPAPLTIYERVFKIPPAHSLILKDGQITLEAYWKLDYYPKIKISEDEAAEELLRLLNEAVKIRLYSDVALGAFLSGGIDSSTVVALMSRLSDTKVKTFSVGFEDSDYSELKYAKSIAERFGTDHHEFIVRPKAIEILPLLVERYGEPYADSSCIPTYYVARETKRYVTVALNGDGGDECFAGYERYQAMLIAEKFRKLPFATANFMWLISRLLPDSVDPKNKLRRIRRFMDGLVLPTKDRYLKWMGIFDGNAKKDLYEDNFACNLKESGFLKFLDPFMPSGNNYHLLDKLLSIDVHNYLPDDLLVKVDIASMANSLEGRSPFLDHKVMEFAARLPVEYKLKGQTKKYILKKAIKGLIPHENIHRRKMGFGVPVGKWFRNELKDFLMENLLSQASLRRGYFKPEVIKNMVDNHTNAKKNYTFQLWSLLMLELWHQKFID